jgi:hypothetical protein
MKVKLKPEYLGDKSSSFLKDYDACKGIFDVIEECYDTHYEQIQCWKIKVPRGFEGRGYWKLHKVWCEEVQTVYDMPEDLFEL